MPPKVEIRTRHNILPDDLRPDEKVVIPIYGKIKVTIEKNNIIVHVPGKIGINSIHEPAPIQKTHLPNHNSISSNTGYENETS